jgi:hypothetical protein
MVVHRFKYRRDKLGHLCRILLGYPTLKICAVLPGYRGCVQTSARERLRGTAKTLTAAVLFMVCR